MKNPLEMTRWEALDAVGECGVLAAQGHWGSLAILLGITDEIAEGMTIDELVQVMSVRMADLALQAGITL